MNEVKSLNLEFQLFQQYGLNTGGMWKVIEIIKNGKETIECLQDKICEVELYNNKEKYIQYFKSDIFLEYYNTENLKLIELKEWKSYFEVRMEYWSDFELISKEENRNNFNKKIFLKQKVKFDELFKLYLTQNVLNMVYKIDETKFHTFETEWKDQIAEDFIFDFNDKLILIHFGWSS